MLADGADICADIPSVESAMPTPLSLGDGLPERIARLVAEDESYEVEFKGESRAPLDDRDLVEAVVPGERQRGSAGRCGG